jgi:hypothetical protein
LIGHSHRSVQVSKKTAELAWSVPPRRIFKNQLRVEATFYHRSTARSESSSGIVGLSGLTTAPSPRELRTSRTPSTARRLSSICFPALVNRASDLSCCELLPGSPFNVRTTRRRNPVWRVRAGWLRVSGWLHKSGRLYISAGVTHAACSADSDRDPRIDSRVRALRTARAASRRDSHSPTAVMHIGALRSTESIENDGAALTPIFPHRHPLDYRVESSRGLSDPQRTESQ